MKGIGAAGGGIQQLLATAAQALVRVGRVSRGSIDAIDSCCSRTLEQTNAELAVVGKAHVGWLHVVPRPGAVH